MVKRYKVNKSHFERSLLKEIKKTTLSLFYTDMWFNIETDKDLIDSCIYQREALNARYATLLAQAKNNNMKFVPFN